MILSRYRAIEETEWVVTSSETKSQVKQTLPISSTIKDLPNQPEYKSFDIPLISQRKQGKVPCTHNRMN